MSRVAIARTLKRLREKSGFTADEVGAMIGKSGKTVNAWENSRGQPDADTLIKLCDIYKVENILFEFQATEKASESAATDSEAKSEERVQILTETFSKLGWLNSDGDISDEQLKILKGIVLMLDEIFGQ